MGEVITPDGIRLHYDEFGEGDRIILTAQAGFYPRGMHAELAKLGYHVFCVTLRGFAPSSFVKPDRNVSWYDVFAQDVHLFADRMGFGRFVYMGASHGAGVGWHLMLLCPERVSAFIAVVPGPHSLEEGTMSYRQMLELGLIEAPPPFDPPVDRDEARVLRRGIRERWLRSLPPPAEEERCFDYGRPMMRLGNEEKLREALRSIRVPTLLLGGMEDPISTPELMLRTAKCLPCCKLVMYSNCGHNADTDITEELCGEADRFIREAEKTGKWYRAVPGEG